MPFDETGAEGEGQTGDGRWEEQVLCLEACSLGDVGEQTTGVGLSGEGWVDRGSSPGTENCLQVESRGPEIHSSPPPALCYLPLVFSHIIFLPFL